MKEERGVTYSFFCSFSIRESAGCKAFDRAAIPPTIVHVSQYQADPYDWRNARHAALLTELSIKCCQQACFSDFLLNPGLKFNCVFAVSAVAPVSDGTDV